VALAHATNGSHPQEDYDDMCKAAGVLRQTALDFLSQDPNRLLTVTYNQDMKSQELLEMTSKEMGLSAEQYLVSLHIGKNWYFSTFAHFVLFSLPPSLPPSLVRSVFVTLRSGAVA